MQPHGGINEKTRLHTKNLSQFFAFFVAVANKKAGKDRDS